MEDFIPTKEEITKINDTKSFLFSILPEVLKEIGSIEIKEVGSTIKGTFVRGSTDIDLYIISENPKRAYELIQAKFPEGKAKKGQLKIWNVNDAIDIDFIFVSPNFSKREDTLKHAEFYSTHLNKHMKFEIIKAKAYLKTKGLYGAEMGSIVGVCIEELVRQKGTWLEVCKFLAFSPKRPSLQDPTMVNQKRDLLASITPEKYTTFLKSCFDYIQNPHFKFKPMTIQNFVEDHEGFCALFWERKEDKALDFQAIHSSATHVRNIITNRERGEAYLEFDTFIDGSKICLVYKAHPKILSQTKEVCLDPKVAKQQGNIKAFTEVHKDSYEKDGLVCARIQRAIQFPEIFFYENLLKRAEKRGYKFLSSTVNDRLILGLTQGKREEN